MSMIGKVRVVGLACAWALACCSEARADCLSSPFETATVHSASGVFVQWVGPVGVCPQESTDFTVDSSDPPNVTLKRLRVVGVAIEQYIVGRTPDGSSQPRDIQSVKSAWNTGEANTGIVVRIGTVSAYPVRTLTGADGVAVDIKRPPVVSGNNPWSSVQIQTAKDSSGNGGHLVGSLFVEANTASPPSGGRVRGSIAGDQGVTDSVGVSDARIEAYAVGEGGSSSATLRVDGFLWNLRLKEHATGNRVEAGHLLRGYVRVEGPLDGTLRFRRIGDGCFPGETGCTANPNPVPTILIEAKDLANPTGPRKKSYGRVEVAGGDLSQSFFPCSPCNVSGWGAEDGEWSDGDFKCYGDWAGKIYCWAWPLHYGKRPSITIGQSASQGANLITDEESSGAIASFKGSQSDPRDENVISWPHIDVWGQMQADTVIDVGQQIGHDSHIRVHGDVHGRIEAMYLYGGQEFGGTKADILVGGDLYGTIKTLNPLSHSDAAHSCHSDKGDITITGRVDEDATIEVAGHVKDYYDLEVGGDFAGKYLATFGPNKKWAGRLHIAGDLTSTGQIKIWSSIDEMDTTPQGGGRIEIDGDAAGLIQLGSTQGAYSSNNPPCAATITWTPSEDPTYCTDDPPPPDSPANTCSTTYADPNQCCAFDFCSCYGNGGHEPEYSGQQADMADSHVQEPGSLVLGYLVIGGRLLSPGSIELVGDLRGNARIQIVRGIDGGTITLPSIRTDNSTAGRLLVDGPFLAGTITLTGDMEGKLLVSDLKPASGSSAVPSILIAGHMHGVLGVRGLMKNALIEFNREYGTTNGDVKVGLSSTTWTGSSGVVDFGDFIIHGDHEGDDVTFVGCFTEPIDTFRSLCREGDTDGDVLTDFCPGATATIECVP